MAPSVRPLLMRSSLSPANPDRRLSRVFTSHTIFRKNYVFLSVVFVSAFGMEIAFDNASNSVWNSVNKGRQWKDLKHKYMESDDE
ncbi:hypothetical protein D6D01_03233 [Aureobasidium pullulans]|uniref:Complex III subunit 9 n=1 Tax=Aureobasidium pullulans TaxID=5580 RepID=A0A4S9LLG3_AURPU|nr:hypothetical protein D6D01_03233 [Aureobasidium pullulans]